MSIYRNNRGIFGKVLNKIIANNRYGNKHIITDEPIVGYFLRRFRKRGVVVNIIFKQTTICNDDIFETIITFSNKTVVTCDYNPFDIRR
jgi:hypothetical protein